MTAPLDPPLALLNAAPMGVLAPVGLPEPAMLPHTEMPTGCRVLLL